MSRPIRGRWAVATRQATAVLNFGILACPAQNWLMPSLR